MKISKAQMKEARLQAKEARRDLIQEARNGDADAAREAREMLDNRTSHSTVQRWMPQPGELVYDTRRGAMNRNICLTISADPTTGYVIVLNSENSAAESIWFTHIRPLIDDEE